MLHLFDGNVLVAMMLPDHPHHQRVHHWLATVREDAFATCSVTEGTLLRLHIQFAGDKSIDAAWKAIASIHAHPRHRFLADGFSYIEVNPVRLTGHRQITDAWLVELAKRHDAKLATLDEGLAVLRPETAFLVPV